MELRGDVPDGKLKLYKLKAETSPQLNFQILLLLFFHTSQQHLSLPCFRFPCSISLSLFNQAGDQRRPTSAAPHRDRLPNDFPAACCHCSCAGALHQPLLPSLPHFHG
uniref:Uncharacterized protein n=1 Tax=Opuntia streptacantha TaxID=393608 RepID=A0A7C8YGR3_OPUST